MSKFFDKMDYELLDKKNVFNGKRIQVEELHYLNPRTNQVIYREHVLAGSASIILPILNNGSLLMIKEVRTPINSKVIAFPAGMLEEGENEEECAIRELEEETGYRAGFVKKLRDVYPAIGYSNEKTVIFLAKDLVKTRRHLDETENIEVVEVQVEEARKMLEKGEIKTASETIALMHYFLYEEKNMKR